MRLTKIPSQFKLNILRSSEIEELIIAEIDVDTAKTKHLIGTAYGQNLMHCAYLGSKYAKDFYERVRWYHVKEPDEELRKLCQEHAGSIGVEFYGEK